MAGFLVIKPQNLEATVNTIRLLPGMGEVNGFESVDAEGVPVDNGEYQLIRIEGDSRFAEFACRNQGYANVVRASHA